MSSITLQSDRWRALRLLYFASLAGLFALIAFEVGPNYLMFGKLTRGRPADFAPVAQERFAPIVQAVLQFKRDNGRFPYDLPELTPKYLPTAYYYGSFEHGELNFWYLSHHVVYRFDDPQTPWRVDGRFANGPVPLPPVVVAPSTSPTTRPNQ